MPKNKYIVSHEKPINNASNCCSFELSIKQTRSANKFSCIADIRLSNGYIEHNGYRANCAITGAELELKLSNCVSDKSRFKLAVEFGMIQNSITRTLEADTEGRHVSTPEKHAVINTGVAKGGLKSSSRHEYAEKEKDVYTITTNEIIYNVTTSGNDKSPFWQFHCNSCIRNNFIRNNYIDKQLTHIIVTNNADASTIHAYFNVRETQVKILDYNEMKKISKKDLVIQAILRRKSLFDKNTIAEEMFNPISKQVIKIERLMETEDEG